MVVYNVTVSVSPAKSAEWLDFMRLEHVPEVLATGAFRDYKICRVLGYEDGGQTFAVQYVAWSSEHLRRYTAEDAPRLQAAHKNRFGQDAVAFRTVLEVIEEGQTKT
jgi:hypothetical protein